MTKTISSLFALALLLSPVVAAATPLKVDPAHTAVGFQIRHLFSNVSGRFDKFEGKIDLDPAAPEKTSIAGTIDAASIDTDNEKRDAHLRSEDFFDVAKYPKITFQSTKVTDVDKEKKTAKIHGDLEMHGVKKAVVLDGAFLGSGPGPQGDQRYGFRGETTINRKDFGIAWNKALDAGGFVLGEDVKISIDVEAME
ncbi:MAG: YceI family protein [Candidatus Binatia bacterium]